MEMGFLQNVGKFKKNLQLQRRQTIIIIINHGWISGIFHVNIQVSFHKMQ